jgi:hypothetical protein
MRYQATTREGMALKGAVLIAGICLVVGPSLAQGEGSNRSYYFSRTAKPYDSYETWLKENPRDTHPYHATVHGPMFHQDNDPKVQEYKTKPLYNQPALRMSESIRPPYGYHRILWVNDRYYSGKYYPTANQVESASGETK